MVLPPHPHHTHIHTFLLPILRGEGVDKTTRVPPLAFHCRIKGSYLAHVGLVARRFRSEFLNNFSFILAQDGNNAVHNAAANGNLEIMELLLEYNADLEMEGEVGIIPRIVLYKSFL